MKYLLNGAAREQISKLKTGKVKFGVEQKKNLLAKNVHCCSCAFRENNMVGNGSCNYICVTHHKRPHKAAECPGYTYDQAVDVIFDYREKEQGGLYAGK